MKSLRHTMLLLVHGGAFLFFAAQASAQFTDVTAAVGLSAEEKKSWGNPLWGDFDNDGFLDIIVPTHGLSLSHGPFVYQSKGGTSFTDIRATSGIEKAATLDSSDWHGFSFGDFDADGKLDLYISEGAKGSSGGTNKRDLLFRGNGDGTFTNVSEAAGMIVSMHRGRCSIWFDYNNDGLLDLFVKNYGDVNDLYKNNGNGTFSIVPNAAGLADATSGLDWGSILSIVDYDNDGYMDMSMTGDNDAQSIYRNQGNGTFVDVTTSLGVSTGSNTNGMAWGDYDNDGLPDLYIARGHLGSPGRGGTLYHNNGNGSLTDASAPTGVKAAGNQWAGIWGDYDNDGYLDLFVTDAGVTGQGPGNANHLFHNNGDGTFTDVAAAQGVALQDDVSLHKSAAWGDYNNDGFLDLLIKDGIGSEQDNGEGASGRHTLLRNTPNGNHFIKVNLQGVQSNRNGIGARVTVTTPTGLSCYRQATGDGGGNYFSQGAGPLHFGIGTAANATVTIVWPSRTIQTISNVAANSTILAVETGGPPPTPTPTPTPTPSATPTPTPAPPVITRQPANRRVTEGSTAKFVVAATGSAPLTYQWSKNGSAIQGATASTYVTPPATLADNGSVFTVTVSNTGGSVTSRSAKLTVSQANRADAGKSIH
ncbi:MAG: FG-GAP-like repeat-containing protein [Chthoniobacterales bacterium]